MQTANRNIFDIEGELAQIAEAFDQLADGGTEDEVLAAVESYFADLLQERDTKLDNIARFIAGRLASAAFRKAEADRLKSLATTDENAAKRLKDYVKHLFDANGWTKLETPLHKFSVQRNGGKAPLVVDPTVTGESIPERFRKVKIELDTDALRSALEAGEDIEWACIDAPGTHLRIK